MGRLQSVEMQSSHPWLLFPLLACYAYAAGGLEISRPVRSWEFVDAVGPKAALFGQESGILEAYVYPLKIVKDLKLRFRIEGRVIPAESIARRIISRPASYTIVYSTDDFEVREELVAPITEPGLLIRVQATSYHPLRIDVEFTRDFQLMWPASIGTSYAEWRENDKVFAFGADGQPYAAILGSPDASLIHRDYATNYSADGADAFNLNTVNGRAEVLIAIAGSMKSRDEALQTWHRLIANASRLIQEAETYYQRYLDQTVQVQLPDKQLQDAYDWSRISVAKGMVDNPLLGEGLVAGYGPSKGAYRPGFAWFFGRDSFWTTFALTSAGDLENARKAIDFIAKYQRDDGKIPHEISQSASLVPWFQNFPYGYDSADATPLFIIAVRNYVDASGDIDFARRLLPRLNKAADFMRSTLDAAGFPKNLGVGHGWVEGGPLLPVDVELYQAGCYVEALRSMSSLSKVLGDAQKAKQDDQEFQARRKALDDTFWLPESRSYAFALDKSGKPVPQPSVLATVPMWFGVLDRDKSQAMIETLSEEPHAADWGMRIISSKAALYGPEGYHYGSVWPLFTGWASVGEYRSHAPVSGLANLRANAWLALDGAGGNTTEVLSGMSYSPLSTASPHQIWSAAMVISPLLRGLFGLEVDVPRRRLSFSPHLPPGWAETGIRNIPFENGKVDLALQASPSNLMLQITNHGRELFDLEFAPAYSPAARIGRAEFNGAPVSWTEERNALDWHPHFVVQAQAGQTRLIIRHSGTFGYTVPFEPPQLGAASQNLKVISERWSNNQRELQLSVSGRPSRQYTIQLTGSAAVESVAGARQMDNGVVEIDMPRGSNSEYVNQAIRIKLKP